MGKDPTPAKDAGPPSADAGAEAGGVQLPGLMAFYALDGNADDSAPTPAPGTMHGPTPTTDRFGRANHAMHFGGSAYIDAPDTNLPVGARARTLSAWFNTSTAAPDWQTIANWGTETTDARFCLTIRGPNPGGPTGILWFSGEKVDVEGAKVVTDGLWHNATVTFNSSVVTLYLDGVYVSSKPLPLNTPQAAFAIGRNVLRSVEYFDGSLDDIRVYDRALTAAEVATLFHETP